MTVRIRGEVVVRTVPIRDVQPEPATPRSHYYIGKQDGGFAHPQTEHAVTSVRRLVRLAVNYSLHSVFGIDQQTRIEARPAAIGAIEEALNVAVDSDVLFHPGCGPLRSFVALLTAPKGPRRRRSGARLRAAT